MLVFATICPHPPAIIPELNSNTKKQAKKTIAAMENLAQEFKKYKAETIIVISPHGPMRYDKFTINLENSFHGNFSDFGVENGSYSFINDTPLAKDIFQKTRNKNLPTEIVREANLDYGTLIPLSYLITELDKKPRLVLLTYTAFDWKMHFNFGKQISKVVAESETPIALVASGDLSHRLAEDAPAGFSPYGKKFDKTLIELLEKNDTEKIMGLNPEFCEEAGECGLRSIMIALGILDGLRTNFQQLSYESPLGVGYLIGRWRIN